MAALRPCPVRITAPASSNITRSQPRHGCFLPLDRSNTMLKIRAPMDRSSTQQLKISHGIRAHSGAAGQPVKPDPEERFVSGLTPEEKKLWERVAEIAKGPPDRPFREEIDVIGEYMKKARDEIFYCESILVQEAPADGDGGWIRTREAEDKEIEPWIQQEVEES